MSRTLLNKLSWRSIMMLALLVQAVNTSAAGKKVTYNINITRTMDQAEPSVVAIHDNIVKNDLELEAVSFGANSVKLVALQGDGSAYGTYRFTPMGYYFASTGYVSTTQRTAVAGISFDQTTYEFSFVHYSGTRYGAQEGTTYTMREALVSTTNNDTIVYVFNFAIGDASKVETDIPAFVHRPDRMDSWPISPYVKVNDQAGERSNFVQAAVGDNVTIGVREKDPSMPLIRFYVTNPEGRRVKNSNLNDYVINSAETDVAGTYTITAVYTSTEGVRTTFSLPIIVDVQEHQGEYFDWEKETPYWSYDFRDEYPNIQQPTKTFSFTQHNGKPAHMLEGEWWTIYWGDNLNTEVWGGKSGETVDGDRLHAMTNAMKKYDEDYAYIRNEMGWPPDLAAREGYKSFVYIFGSGINRDNTSNTEQGGYQSATRPDNANKSYACVYASWAPISRFRDDASSRYSDVAYQTDAMIHEGIHATFADYPGVKASAWFQEAGNVWLQGAMNARRGQGAQVSGWLGVGNLICPFMPIECYSGWLQDGSFGGPAAEGVNMYGSEGQICTWRNLIGGVQYGETFPIFLGLNVGFGSVPWIWRYCQDYVLKGIAQGNKSEGVEGIGDEGMRLLIMHYRAKLATMDFKESSAGMRSLLDGAFGTIVKPEWEPYWINCAPFSLTPYQTLTLNDAEGWMAPDPLTNPGWSGGNIIPVHVGKDGCEIFFRPEDDNMLCQLCYRTRDGRTFYSQPVKGGRMVLNWNDSNQPANGVIFVVPCNTDYIYEGEAQRKKHWDYRIKLGRGAYAPADIRQRWYFYERTITDPTFNEDIYTDVAQLTPVADTAKEPTFRIISSVLKAGHKILLDLGGVDASEVNAHLVGIDGVIIDEQRLGDDASVQLPSSLRRGMYILALEYQGQVQSFKVYAE